MVAISAQQPSSAAIDTTRQEEHRRVGPVPIYNGNFTDAVRWCAARIRSGTGSRVATANLDFIAQARSNRTLARDLRNSDLVVADGAPVAWLARLTGGRRTRRVTGVDLTAGICEALAPEGLRVAFYGSTEDLQEGAAERLEALYPGVRVVAKIAPPFRALTAEELVGHLAELEAADPQLVLVALGCPRQERFIAEHAARIPGATWIGVGGTFDFFAGKRTRAPRALQAIGAEWLVRLVQEPGRLWRRYLLRDAPALIAVLPGCLLRRGA